MSSAKNPSVAPTPVKENNIDFGSKNMSINQTLMKTNFQTADITPTQSRDQAFNTPNTVQSRLVTTQSKRPPIPLSTVQQSTMSKESIGNKSGFLGQSSINKNNLNQTSIQNNDSKFHKRSNTPTLTNSRAIEGDQTKKLEGTLNKTLAEIDAKKQESNYDWVPNPNKPQQQRMMTMDQFLKEFCNPNTQKSCFINQIKPYDANYDPEQEKIKRKEQQEQLKQFGYFIEEQSEADKEQLQLRSKSNTTGKRIFDQELTERIVDSCGKNLLKEKNEMIPASGEAKAILIYSKENDALGQSRQLISNENLLRQTAVQKRQDLFNEELQEKTEIENQNDMSLTSFHISHAENFNFNDDIQQKHNQLVEQITKALKDNKDARQQAESDLLKGTQPLSGGSKPTTSNQTLFPSDIYSNNLPRINSNMSYKRNFIRSRDFSQNYAGSSRPQTRDAFIKADAIQFNRFERARSSQEMDDEDITNLEDEQKDKVYSLRNTDYGSFGMNKRQSNSQRIKNMLFSAMPHQNQSRIQSNLKKDINGQISLPILKNKNTDFINKNQALQKTTSRERIKSSNDTRAGAGNSRGDMGTQNSNRSQLQSAASGQNGRLLNQFSVSTQGDPNEELVNFDQAIQYDENDNCLAVSLIFGHPQNPITSTIKIEILEKHQMKQKKWIFDDIWSTKQDRNFQESIQNVYIRGKDEELGLKTTFCFFRTTQEFVQKQGIIKDTHLLNLLNKAYESQPQECPCPTVLRLPSIYKHSRNQFDFMHEIENFSTLDSILEFRSAVGKPWEEDELLNIFYSLLHSLNELRKINICHANISPDSIVFCYQTQRYKLFNYHCAQIFPFDFNHQKQTKFPIFVRSPFIPPEIRIDLENDGESLRYDVMAVDMYALGVCMLLMKFLVPEQQRTIEIVRLKSQFLREDTITFSSQLILKFLLYDPKERTQLSYEKAMTLIQEKLEKTGKFKDFRIPPTTQIKALNPVSKFKWLNSREPQVISDFYYRCFQWEKVQEQYKWIYKSLKDEKRDSMPYYEEFKLVTRRLVRAEFHLGNFQRAAELNEEYFKNLQSIDPLKFPITEEMAEDYQYSGKIKWNLNGQIDAILDMQECLKIRMVIFGENDRQILEQMEEVARHSYSLQNYEICLENYGQIRMIMKNSSGVHQQEYASILEQMALICQETHDYNTSIQYLDEILDLIVQTDDSEYFEPYDQARTHLILAQVYTIIRNPDSAQKNLELAIAILTDIRKPGDKELIEANIKLSQILKSQGEEQSQIIELLEKNVLNAQNSKQMNPADQINILKSLADQLIQYGYEDNALQFYLEALKLSIGQQQDQVEIVKLLEDQIKQLQEKRLLTQQSDTPLESKHFF